jgi:hypothetical protein
MGDSGGGAEMAMVGGKMDDNESERERVFNVGEVVEFWEGAFVRGYRQAPGEPAFVKRVEGNGLYAIKMVGSNRGKFRVVGWKNLFREGSFNKNVCRTDSGRVRGQARLKERAEAAAEARFGAELRKTRDELAAAEKAKNDIVTEGEKTLKKQEREARHTEKNLTARHKRQLEEMRGDLDKRQDSDIQARDELDRQGRQKTRQVQRNLEKAHTDLSDVIAEKERLIKAVRRGAATLEGVQKDGLGWQGKFTDQQDKMKDREKLLTSLEMSVVEKQRQIAALRNKCEDLAHKLEERNDEISTHAALTREVSLILFSLLFLSSNLLFSLLFQNNREGQRKKKETVK